MQGPQQSTEQPVERAPSPPPRPPLAATSRALSLPHVVTNILEHLELLHILDKHGAEQHQHECGSQASEHSATAALVSCASVAPVWRAAVHDLLNYHLVFSNGTTIRKWLDGHADEGAPRSTTRSVRLVDNLPFKPSTRDGDGAKWSYADIASLLAKVKGIQHLEIAFVRQDEIPGDLLTDLNLATLEYLDLGCPVSKPTKPLPFTLDTVQLVDPHAEDARLKRDWTSTAILLGTSPALAQLRVLRLDSFPRAAEYLMRMFRLAPRIKSLFLAELRPDPNSWQLQVFAQLCTRLHSVIVERLVSTGADVLPSFATGPPTIGIGSVHAVVGHRHPHVLGSLVAPCPIEELFKALWRCEPMKVRRVLLHDVHWASHDYEGALAQTEGVRGIRFSFGRSSGMSEDDMRLLHQLMEQSCAIRRWQQQAPGQQIDELA